MKVQTPQIVGPKCLDSILILRTNNKLYLHWKPDNYRSMLFSLEILVVNKMHIFGVCIANEGMNEIIITNTSTRIYTRTCQAKVQYAVIQNCKSNNKNVCVQLNNKNTCNNIQIN